MRTHIKATVTKDGNMNFSEMAETPRAKRFTHCRGCIEGSLEPVLSLGNQYVVGFVKEITLNLPRVPLNLMRCNKCGLLQLEHSTDVTIFSKEYWYRSSVNKTMRDALDDVVKTGLQYVHHGRWLDIGANDGYLLSQVPPGFTKIACEPALNFTDKLDEIADYVIPSLFSADNSCLYDPKGLELRSRGGCDVITSCAMFYDLDDPNKFVKDIATVLSPDGIWINQLNDSPTMLKANAFDSICHEHVTYYDVHSLSAIYERNGLSIIGITYNDVNGGSIRVVAEKAVSKTRKIQLHDHKRVSERDAELFADRTRKWKTTMTNLVTGTLSYTNKTWLYGASTKGMVMLQYLDLNEAFCGLAERNPAKFGLKMAGTWIPIRPEEEMRADRPQYVMVLPWAFKQEFVEREKALLEDGTTMIFPLPNIEFVS